MQEPRAFGSQEQFTLLEHRVGVARYRRGMSQVQGGGAWYATLRTSSPILKVRAPKGFKQGKDTRFAF